MFCVSYSLCFQWGKFSKVSSLAQATVCDYAVKKCMRMCAHACSHIHTHAHTHFRDEWCVIFSQSPFSQQQTVLARGLWRRSFFFTKLTLQHGPCAGEEKWIGQQYVVLSLYFLLLNLKITPFMCISPSTAVCI